MNINLPNSWNDVSLDQFLQLTDVNSNNLLSVFEIKQEKLAILANTTSDDEVFDDLTIDELNKLYDSIGFLNEQPKIRLPEYICSSNFIVLNFHKITIGEFIDLESNLKNTNDINFKEIASILSRKYKIGDWGEIIIEPYDAVDNAKREEDIMDATMIDVYSIVMSYIQFRNNVLDAYKNLFEPEIEDETDEVELSEEELEELREIAEDENRLMKWNWERFLYTISDGDLIKAKQMLNMGLIYTFNMLAMKKELKLD